LRSFFWDPNANLVGHSYGGYLLLHSLSELEPFPGRILLFSPVLGEAIDKRRRFGSRPPRAGRLMELARKNQFPTLGYLEIHTGENDNGCDPNLDKAIGSFIPKSRIEIVSNQGHELPLEYITKVIVRFLNRVEFSHPH
jgi:hypothetical protein